MQGKSLKIEKEKIKVGMTVAVDVSDIKGKVLISSGIKLKDYHIDKINSLHDLKYIYIVNPYAKNNEEVLEEFDSVEIEEVEKISVEQIREEVSEQVKTNLKSFADPSDPSFVILFDVVEKLLSSILENEKLLYEVNKIQSADNYIYNHSINTAILSILVGISMGFKKEELFSIGKGAFFSDIGKLQIDPLILSKPDNLSPEEMEEVKRYPEYGYEFMKSFDEMDKNALESILYARERWDGTGYPKGLSGTRIHTYAQIVGFASCFDALCSERVYRSAVSPYKAMSLTCNEVDRQFNSEILKKAIKILGYYNVGMFVELTSSDIAKVRKKGRHKPVLTLIQGVGVNNVSHVYEIDMAKNPSVKIKEVLLKTEYDKLIDYM